MKNVLVIGASGSLATVVIDKLKGQKDIDLSLFARKKSRIANPGDSSLIEGDATNYKDIRKAVEGQDIVYINLAGDLETMTKNIVKAMHDATVNRVIAISSIGIYNSPMDPVLKPYRKLADIIEASGLDYTILRPDWFTNANEVEYAITHKGEPEKGSAISRKSIAAFVTKIIENPELHKNENLGISKPA